MYATKIKMPRHQYIKRIMREMAFMQRDKKELNDEGIYFDWNDDNILKITNKRTLSIISFNLPMHFNLDSLKNLLKGQKLVKDIFENNIDTSDLFTFLIENALIDFSFHSFKK